MKEYILNSQIWYFKRYDGTLFDELNRIINNISNDVINNKLIKEITNINKSEWNELKNFKEIRNN